MATKEMIISIEDIIDQVKEYNQDNDDIILLNKAYEYANAKHFGQRRITGEEYIQHPLHVTMILAKIKMDIATLIAGLLHDTLEDTESTPAEIEELFGKDVLFLVDGVTKINKINFSNVNDQIVANQRKILVALSEDVRVLIIKLADRLHNMRTLYALSDAKQKKKAKETLEILTPIAHRLGIDKIKSELEDLSLRYLKPDVYYDIVEKLNLKKSERDEAVGKMIKEVSELLDQHNIKYEIKGRSKSIYSIYTKLLKGRNFDDIYDLHALRIMLDTEQECYLVLGLIHSKYKHLPKRFKDYIAMPKTNFYQSLHTTVFGIDTILFEIQIRTYEMNRIAEYGVASHWSYKENTINNRKTNFDQKLQLFRMIMELNDETGSPEEFIDYMRSDILTSDNIYIYTPKGDIVELPLGATCVDFAYKVHSEIGDTLVGAIVNNNIVPLNYVLQNGDIIKVNTNNASRGPSKDWLKFVITSHAKNRIRSFYSKLEKDSNIEKGRDILEKEIRRSKIPFDNFFTDQNMDKIFNKYHINNGEELYNQIATNRLSPLSIVKFILDKEEITHVKKHVNKISSTNNGILVGGLTDIKVNIASCCKPIPGDHIIGYITKNNGISVHRMACHNICDTDARLINVEWETIITRKYPSAIMITTNNHNQNNLLEIITVSASCSVQIESVVALNKTDCKIYSIVIYIENKKTLSKYINSLNQLANVTKVERIIE